MCPDSLYKIRLVMPEGNYVFWVIAQTMDHALNKFLAENKDIGVRAVSIEYCEGCLIT